MEDVDHCRCFNHHTESKVLCKNSYLSTTSRHRIVLYDEQSDEDLIETQLNFYLNLFKLNQKTEGAVSS